MGHPLNRKIFAFLCFFLCLPSMALSQQEKSKSPVTIPFVGCKPDDTDFPKPIGNPVRVNMPSQVALKLAFYSSGNNNLVAIGPRGWNCTYHSMGIEELVISPDDRNAVAGDSIIKVRFTDVGTPSNISETYSLAFQLFPKDLAGADIAALRRSQKLNGSETVVHSDRLIYLNSDIVEFVTPHLTSGFESQFLGPKNGGLFSERSISTPNPISGFVGFFFISNFQTPFDNLKGALTVGVKLPKGLSDLSHYILDYSERDFEKDNHLRE